MSQTLTKNPFDLTEAVNNLVTEDDEPVDNLLSGKQQRLLTEPLYSFWTPPQEEGQSAQRRPFWASANVGIFPSLYQPPLVPDIFLSLDVAVPEDMGKKSNRSYFYWEYGKAPEVVIEIVSNRKGGELSSKLRDYARIGVTYYVVYDPLGELSDEELQVFVLRDGRYELMREHYLPLVGLGLTLWQGMYEGITGRWLRWCDRDGNVIPTGEERAAREAERAAREAERAAREAAARQEAEARLRAEIEARQQAEAEVARLREELARLRSQT